MTDDWIEAGLIDVLICDDNAEIRELLTEIIALEPGFRVVGHARDGCELIASAKRLQPHVITLDLAMPDKNGLQALSELAVVAPTAQTIIISAYAAPSVAGEAMRRGAVRYIEKGITVVDDLLLALRTYFPIPLATGRS